MKNQNFISLFVLTFSLAYLFVIAFPGYGNAQDLDIGCCQYEGLEGQQTCFQTEGPQACPQFFEPFVGFFDNQECTDSGVCTVPERAVPTMSEWGMIATAGVLGIIGFIAIRRRKLAA